MNTIINNILTFLCFISISLELFLVFSLILLGSILAAVNFDVPSAPYFANPIAKVIDTLFIIMFLNIMPTIFFTIIGVKRMRIEK